MNDDAVRRVAEEIAFAVMELAHEPLENLKEGERKAIVLCTKEWEGRLRIFMDKALAQAREEGRERGNRLEAALRGLAYWVERVHRDCGASMEPKLQEAMDLAELALDHSEDWRDASPARDLARRVEELEEDRDALVALGRAARRLAPGLRGSLRKSTPTLSFLAVPLAEELLETLEALPARVRERLEGEKDG